MNRETKGMCMGLLCVDFAGWNSEDYNYDLVIKDYESVGINIEQKN